MQMQISVIDTIVCIKTMGVIKSNFINNVHNIDNETATVTIIKYFYIGNKFSVMSTLTNLL
jgi:hypothetical protein